MEHAESNFDILISDEKEYISIAASGNYSLIRAKNLFKFSIDNALLYDRYYILIDVSNIKGEIPFLDRFLFAEYLAIYKMQFPGKSFKIAMFGHEPIVDKNKFGETVAVNRGVNVRVFTNLTESLNWLNAK